MFEFFLADLRGMFRDAEKIYSKLELNIFHIQAMLDLGMELEEKPRI